MYTHADTTLPGRTEVHTSTLVQTSCRHRIYMKGRLQSLPLFSYCRLTFLGHNARPATMPSPVVFFIISTIGNVRFYVEYLYKEYPHHAFLHNSFCLKS